MEVGEGIRQGDVILVRVKRGTIPADARVLPRDARGRVIVEIGEVTGHAHAIAEPGVDYVETGTADAVEHWLRVSAGVPVLGHEEHSAHELPDPEYARWKAYEYSPRELRQVAD